MPDPSRFHLTLTSAGRPVMHGWWLLEATARGKFVSWIGGYGGLPDARVALVDQETGTLLDVWPGVVGARWLRELDAPPGTAPGAGRSAARSTVAVNTWEQQLRRDYKPRYVKSIMSVMRVMFDDAVQSKVCGDNPVPTLKSRRLGKYKGKQQHDATILPPPARQALLLARNAREMRGIVGYALVLTIADCGLRISEAAALRREHLFLDDQGQGCRLLVKEQHQYVDGKPGQVDPKYGSTGNIVLPPFLAGLLCEVLGSHKSPWLFPSANGKKMSTSAYFYSDIWRRWVDGHTGRAGQARPACPDAGHEGGRRDRGHRPPRAAAQHEGVAG